MSHDPTYRGSYSLAFQALMQRLLRSKPRSAQDLTLVYPHITTSNSVPNDFYRPEGSSVHGGIDFNYVGGQSTVNTAGENPVFAPVTGTVVALQDAIGGVVIRSDQDGTLHRILHLHTTAVSYLPPNNRVVAGETQLGTMGGKGAGPGQS